MPARSGSSTSISTISPVTVKMTRSQMLATRSAVRSRLWATHSRYVAKSVSRGLNHASSVLGDMCDRSGGWSSVEGIGLRRCTQTVLQWTRGKGRALSG